MMRLDLLERRVLFAAGVHHGVLIEQGTSGADLITFEKSGGQLIVSDLYKSPLALADDTTFVGKDKNGLGKFLQTQTFNLADFKSIEVDAFGGNDTVIVGKLDVPCLINGASGDDTLAGGSSADTINGGAGNDVLNGNAGDDSLTGNAGDDTLNGGTGGNHLNGGAGVDHQGRVEGFDTLTGDTEDPGVVPDHLLIENPNGGFFKAASAFRTGDSADVQVDVDLLFSSSGFLADWGKTTRIIDAFSVPVAIEAPTGGVFPALMGTRKTFDLGKLGNGTYSFAVTAGKTQLGQISFTVAPGWRGARLQDTRNHSD